MKYHHTMFGKTKVIEPKFHGMKDGEVPDKILWVERGEDYYALMSKKYKNKKVVIVTREAWLRGKEIKGKRHV